MYGCRVHLEILVLQRGVVHLPLMLALNLKTFVFPRSKHFHFLSLVAAAVASRMNNNVHTGHYISRLPLPGLVHVLELAQVFVECA